MNNNNDKFRPSARRINGLVIYFKDKICVQVSDEKMAINIHRWPPRGGGVYRRAWYPFCQWLKHNNSIDNIFQVMNMASSYGLMITKARHPEEPPQHLWEHPKHYTKPKAPPRGLKGEF